ncbi:MAG: PIG-L family deacetylase [Acidimicrobiaceae bacterium]|nr:PIG-L family deacetylase [Acidimicrobiaceae bacterium]MYC91360.1 PIG-L family deacetylase [Gemmatimonadota bacterium]MCY3642454.1 PIG-L family deacetylase [Acidimicrobiaceae bacterium]MDE0665490.1 PIG-L family deacetylase [Acidimicrobiaceae bacterium]MXW89582.1 PIG-L family deacetylase [Acidimicrobiaceae bacterium]
MRLSSTATRVLAHISPHPDDEALGSPGVLLALQRTGWRVVNFVVTMGRPEHRERRSREAACAARTAGFELRTPREPIGLSSADDLSLGFDRVRSEVRSLLDELRPAIVVAPSPHDGHHGHEMVGRAVLSALRNSEVRPRLWLWGLWADLPFPTIYAPFDDAIMERVQQTIRCYTGEVDRNDYATLLLSRARTRAILGVERVFGYGQERVSCAPYADLLTECLPDPGGWLLGSARLLRPPSEPAACATEQDIRWWLESTSPHDRRRRLGQVRAPDSDAPSGVRAVAPSAER